jgi:hypothetical protein
MPPVCFWLTSIHFLLKRSVLNGVVNSHWFLVSNVTAYNRFDCIQFQTIFPLFKGIIPKHNFLMIKNTWLSVKRKVKEALHIKARRPSLNRDSGIELPSVYDLILNWIHNTWQWTVNCHQQQLQPANKWNRQSAEEGLVTRLKYTVIKSKFSSVERKHVLMLNAGGSEFTF